MVDLEFKFRFQALSCDLSQLLRCKLYAKEHNFVRWILTMRGLRVFNQTKWTQSIKQSNATNGKEMKLFLLRTQINEMLFFSLTIERNILVRFLFQWHNAFKMNFERQKHRVKRNKNHSMKNTTSVKRSGWTQAIVICV